MHIVPDVLFVLDLHVITNEGIIDKKCNRTN